MTFDEILEHVGEFGYYQVRVLLTLCIPCISLALHDLAGVFLNTPVPFRCKLPIDDDSATYSVLPHGAKEHLVYPWDHYINGPSRCWRYDTDFTDAYFKQNITATKTVKCDAWIFDKEDRHSTIVTEWNLVCDRAWLKALTNSALMFGYMIGSCVFGNISDRSGRKPVYICVLIAQGIFGVLTAITIEIYSYLFTRAIVGMTGAGYNIVGYVIAVEIVGTKRRIAFSLIYMTFFAIGYLVSSGIAYIFRGWRGFQLAISLPGIIYFSYIWLIPESARWLLAKGKVDKAKISLQKIAKGNKRVYDEQLVDRMCTEIEEDRKKVVVRTEDKPTYIDLCRYPNLRKKTFIIFFLWGVISGTYYGLAWGTPDLGGNEYINFVISGLVELLSYIGLLFVLDVHGRKCILCSSMILTGVSLLVSGFVPERIYWLRVTAAMTGKFAISAAFATVYVFTVEQYPTVIRNIGIGGASTCARIGSLLAPFVNFTGEFWPHLPMLIFGGLALSSGFLTLLLPETLGRQLPDTIIEGENFGKKT